ncbi:hypothetical protein B7494_g6975 [Chlorociboria aeruginascens]|nr:hypothetical protein B7494_g6975 [Chlorociboria aeruginascens]
MRFSSSPFVLLTAFFTFLSQTSATRLIEAKSLNTCQANSSFTASLFDVTFTPDNSSIAFDIVFMSTIQGNITVDIIATAYGLVITRQTIDPCSQKALSGLCPMNTGQVPIQSTATIDSDTLKDIPGIAYTVPDLDATVRVLVNLTSNPDVSVACVEADLSNGETVDQKGIGWSTAVISGLALVASAVTSGLGHSNTAAHVAANALSLFGYFQAQAIVGLTSVPLPPIVQSWTQNFDWTMGIIEVDFMQSIATWYQKSTGGTPATVLNTLTTTSVTVQKRSLVRRSLNTAARLVSRGAQLARRSSPADSTTGTYVVKGIKRVAFRADMEATNLFLTGVIFFCIFIVFTIIFVAVFKAFCELAVKNHWMKTDKFLDFRNGWLTVLKGIMFRMVLIGYPQMTILCLWEFTQVDSPAEVVLAIFFFFGMTATLGWASMKVIRIAKRSVAMHKNPAYILYSDPSALNKWGFLYVQYRASAYYFVLPMLVYTLIKGMFIAFGQGNGTVQAIALVIIEAAALIAASVIRPWMDKSTNTFNISICAINFLNAIFLLIYTDVFNQPGLVTGVVGVVFFVINAAFSLVLIILVLIATIYALVRKDPDTRYQPVADDRASFIKSSTQLNTELDALGATARGDMKGGYKHALDLDDDSESLSGDSMRHPANMPLPPSTANSGSASYGDPPRSPVNPSVPLFPAGRGAPPSYDNPRNMYHAESRPNSDLPLINRNNSPSPYNNSTSNLSYRAQNNASTAVGLVVSTVLSYDKDDPGDQYFDIFLKDNTTASLKDYIPFILPLSQNPWLLDSYINATGHIRLGTLFMDLDALAGVIAYKHTGDAVMTVTAAVDRITLKSPLNEICDLELSGRVTFATGRSSMEVSLQVARARSEGEERGMGDILMECAFTMVSLDPHTKKPTPIAPLLTTTAEEKQLFAIGQENYNAKKALAKYALRKQTPNDEESDLIHALWLKQLNFSGTATTLLSYRPHYSLYQYPNTPHTLPTHALPMSRTTISSVQIMQPQYRNRHNFMIFGGFLLKSTFELAFTCVSATAHSRPKFLSLDPSTFENPVPVGSVLYLTASVVFTDRPLEEEADDARPHQGEGEEKKTRIMIRVDSEIRDVEHGIVKPTGRFHYTFEVEKAITVVPESYGQYMMYLDARRRSGRVIDSLDKGREGIGGVLD